MRVGYLLLVLMCAGGVMAGGVQSLRRTGTFKSELADVRWDAEYPVAIPGWSMAELEALWQKIDEYCFLPSFCSEEYYESAKPARPAFVLGRVVERLTSAETGETTRHYSLDVIAEVKIPFASKDWVGFVFDGYENEGGNGCHALGMLAVRDRKTLEPMPLEWFVRDVPGLKRHVLQSLATKLAAEDEDFSEREALLEKVESTPSFIPTPEGVRFRYASYEVLPGYYCLPEVTVPWRELIPFCDANRLTELNALSFPRPKAPKEIEE